MRPPALNTVALLLCLASCSAPLPAPAHCDATTCLGCCDATGTCQAGRETLACGTSGETCARCASGTTCTLAGRCEVRSVPDASVSLDAGAGDAGAPDAGRADGGAACAGGLLTNPGFECALDGWLVLEGAGSISQASAWEGTHSLDLVADAQGQARVGRANALVFPTATTLCVSVRARGTSPQLRLEALVSPVNVANDFTAPVMATWTKVPPTTMKVAVDAASTVSLYVRALAASPGQHVELDGFEVTTSASGLCP
jgi:hypothetical protein